MAGPVDEIIARAIRPASVRNDGRHTAPRSYGVYRLPVTSGATRRYRFGNHSVRMLELERDFGGCELVHLFSTRTDAETVAKALNADGI